MEKLLIFTGREFIEINMEELKEAVLDYGQESWYDLVRESTSPTKYPCGVYFYKLMTGDFVETRKMLLVK